jgi:hypothetical protein
MVRQWFDILSLLMFVAIAVLAQWWPAITWSLLVFVPLFLLGVYDSLQTKHTLLRNFPVIGHGPCWMEVVRPEIQLETRPYGTRWDVYRVGYEWASHGIAAPLPAKRCRV